MGWGGRRRLKRGAGSSSRDRRESKGEREEEEEEKEGKGGKRRMKLGVVRSRNKAVDKWLGEEDVRVGEDGFGDLEDFLV